MIKIPKGLEKFEKVLEKYDLKDILSMAYRGINVPHDFRKETPSFAAIAKFNSEENLYELFTKLMHKHVGKYGAATMMKVAVENDMGIDFVEELWNDRNISLSYNFINALETCDEKYIRFFISTDKFIKLVNKGFGDATIITWVKQYAVRLITIGYENPKFAKILLRTYSETQDEIFLPNATKDIFLF